MVWLRRAAAGALAVSLVSLSACGTRWTDAQEAAVAARRRPVLAQQTAAAPEADASAGVDTPDAAARDTPTVNAAGGEPRANASVKTASTTLPCAAHTTAPGVTDDSISVGTIASLTGPSPGLGASAVAAVRAYVDFRNASGGVCGRRIELRRADDGTDTGRYRSDVLDLNPHVLGLTGGFSVGDAGGVDVVRQTKIPVVNVPTSHFLADVPNVFDIDPNFAPGLVAGKYKYLSEHGARRAYVAYIAIDQSRFESSEHIRLMRAAGIDVVKVQEIPLATISFDSIARDIANSRADYLYFIGDTRANIAITKAVDESGYDLKFIDFLAYAYNQQYIDQTGQAGEGAMVWLRTAAVEDAAVNPEMARFVQWMTRSAPADQQDDLAIHSWIGAKTFFDMLEKIPGPISRDALIAQLQSIGRYDADGMLQPVDFRAEISHGCMVGLHVDHGHWRRLVPATGFLC